MPKGHMDMPESARRSAGILWIACGLVALAFGGCSDPIVLFIEQDGGPPGEPDVPGQDEVGPQPDAGPDAEDLTPSRCRIPPAPDLSPLRVARAFPNLTFNQPIYLTSARDGSDRLFVVEKRGVIHVFPNNPNVVQSQVFLDLTDRVFSRTGNDERGLLGLAFDPDFARNGYFWVNYTTLGPGTPTTISRFSVQPGNPDAGNPASEVIALRFIQPYGNHNGGMVDFGPDGHLYVGVGDGGGSGDPDDHGQNLSTLLGTILRMDVSNLGPNGEYRVPPDNPFVNQPPARPEIWAWGLRNPWRFSFDRLTGQLWAADVGQRRIEEIDVITRGGNYGWRKKEGFDCYNPVEGCDQPDFIAPVAQYSHEVGLSITGGYVYRGARLPEMSGSYIYGDFGNGQIFAVVSTDDEEAESPLGHKTARGNKVVELAQTGIKISSFGEDEAGEIYIVDYALGGIHQLERAGGVVEPTEPLPLTLTETGCFDDVAAQVPERKLIPYDVNAQLWSDDASKERFFVLPVGAKITYDPVAPWAFPDGSIIVKNFYLDAVAGDPSTRRIIETRFLVREAETYRGYSYQWNDAQTEGFLLPGAATKDFQIQDGGQTRTLTWAYPSRSQCRACHTDASGQVLGLSTGQMNLAGPNGDNQIDRFAARGLFANPPGPAADLPVYPDPYGTAPLADRARAYIHANCAHCHLPNGVATSDIDLRFETPLARTLTCNEEPKEGDLGTVGLKLLQPGNAQNSSVYRRMLLRNDESMPPFASAVVDQAGADLIRDWINALQGCQ